MLVSALHAIWQSNAFKAAGPVLFNGVAYGIDGAIVGVAAAAFSTIGFFYITSRKDSSAMAAAPFALLATVPEGAKYGALTGLAVGVIKTTFFV